MEKHGDWIEHMELYGTVKKHMEKYGTVWKTSMGNYVKMENNNGKYGTKSMDTYGNMMADIL